ncbi:type II CRISPR RNA-guided endonuclease Cas9 [Rothia mucilaginosa]
MSTDMKNYRIGVDVGDRSVGLAAIEFDDAGLPIKKLALATFRHDGGLDPTKNKTPMSRKETRGIARRTMRMTRRRKQRLRDLDKVLEKLGYTVPEGPEPETYEAWTSRALLASIKLASADELNEHLVRAVRHMARHRGWANPWWSLDQLEKASQEPSKTFEIILARARELFGEKVPANPTLGMLGALAANNEVLLRPRAEKKRKTGYVRGTPLMVAQVRQGDQLAELRRICEVQGIEDQYEVLRMAVFYHKPPYVPKDRVGKDPLNPDEIRASRASLEFQEFRILDSVANLRVRTGSRTKRELSECEYDTAVDFLMSYTGKEQPSWADVAEEIGVPGNRLIAPVLEDVQQKTAPFDRSSAAFEKAMKAKTEARKWWESNDDDQLRSLFIMFLADATDDTTAAAEQAGLYDLFASWPEEERETLSNIAFESGRAGYSATTLSKLSKYMHEYRVGLHEARKAVFGVDDTWRPPLDKLEEPTGQPAVDRVLTILRRFVLDCERQWGRPHAITVEHARTGLMGPTQRQKILNEQKKNRTDNERISGELRESGVDNPSRAEVRRHLIVQEQECQCLYCGTMITTTTSELDHIVSRAGGGSSRRENLAAVCRRCNGKKNRELFYRWAGPVRLQETIDRVRQLQAFKDPKKAKMFKNQIRRLKQTEADEPIDERSLASTSYAAVAVRERLDQHFNEGLAPDDKSRVVLDVYAGSVTRESRRAGDIDERILLRGERDKNRFDVRHHAIDAAVMTLLNRSVALTLEQRSQLRRAFYEQGLDKLDRDQLKPEEDWRDFIGLYPASQEKFLEWRKAATVLGDLLAEAIEDDSIAVVSPLRLRPQNGAVHKDTIAAVKKQTLGSAWSADAVKRIVDPEIYLAMKDALGKLKKLPEDSARTLELPDGRCIEADDEVLFFPKNAASILTPRGVAEIGESIHHARLYGWLTKKGELKVGMLRVYGAEFPWLMRESGSRNVLSMPIHPGSQSFRGMQDAVRKVVESGEAVEFAWITQNDELEFDPDDYIAHGGEDDLRRFLEYMPECRWRVDGFYDVGRLRIRPALLSREQFPRDIQRSLDEKKPLTVEQQVIVKSLEKGLAISLGNLMGLETMRVIRRNNLGFPRWRGNGSLPTSFEVRSSALRALGMEG